MKFGIDVSKYQKGLKLSKAKAEGVEFVIIKAGGADKVLYKDSCFEEFYQDAVNTGMLKGAYFFGYAASVNEAIVEADYFCELLKGKSFDLPVWYDVEADRQRKLPIAMLESIINAFVDRMNEKGYRCGVYGSSISGFKEHFPNIVKMNWVASYGKTKPSTKGLVMWQFGGEVNVLRSNKIAGYVCDQDYLYDESIIGVNVAASEPVEKVVVNNSYDEFVRGIQKAIGVNVDGKAGPITLSHTITLSRKKNPKHSAVKCVQKYLNSLGYDCGSVDGIFGIKTENGVRKYQAANGCLADGEITAKQKTWKKLLMIK